MRIDLHVHSNASDGTDPPGDLVRKAWSLALKGAPLDGVALTDHDTIAGYGDAAAALEALVGPAERQFVVVPGAEISCILGDVSLHLLGYLFDPANEPLAAELELLRTDRIRRAKAIVGKRLC